MQNICLLYVINHKNIDLSPKIRTETANFFEHLY